VAVPRPLVEATTAFDRAGGHGARDLAISSGLDIHQTGGLAVVGCGGVDADVAGVDIAAVVDVAVAGAVVDVIAVVDVDVGVG